MREEIINILKDKDCPSKALEEIINVLELETIEEYKTVQKELNLLVKDGIVYYSEKKKKYLLMENSHFLKGKLLVNKKGFGFVVLDDSKSEDVYISERNINSARNNDIVQIEIINKKDNEGRIVKVISRDNSNIIGEFYTENNKFFVKSDKKGNSVISIPEGKTKGAVDGHKVVVRVLDDKAYVGEIVQIIGHKNDVGVDILSYVYEYEFSPNFPDEVMSYLDNVPETVKEEDMKNRFDLRNEMIFTIDGDDTKDIDDAISIKKIDQNNYELGVHIADVSHYVELDGVLDKEAYVRGTSVYLVDRVLPMLPHKLSNGICSLNPNVDRLALSCIMNIDGKGNVTKYQIKQTIIKSRKQMTYNCVNDILEKNIIPTGYEEYVDSLKLMKELSDILRKKMVNRGYLEFDKPEAKIIVDEKCHPIEIKLREQRTGEKLIENFMIVANETVGSDIFYKNLPGIYRVHDKPNEEKLRNFISFLSLKGYVVNANQKDITAKDIQNILKSLEGKPESNILNTLAIMSQAKAIYSEENIGHFGLGSKCYSHFTSPIRRYPDLTLHRLVKDYQDNYSDDTIDYWKNKLPEIALNTSKKEQDSVDCERDVDKMKKAEYMEDHIGEEFLAIVSGVTEFGMFVELPNTVEGLVKIEDMGKDYYHYNETLMALVGKKSNKKYMFGDEVRVKVIAASRQNSTVDFELVEGDKTWQDKK